MSSARASVLSDSSQLGLHLCGEPLIKLHILSHRCLGKLARGRGLALGLDLIALGFDLGLGLDLRLHALVLGRAALRLDGGLDSLHALYRPL